MSNSEFLSPISKGNLSDLIVNRITQQIVSGELKPGDKLPTEMEFSESLGVSRNVVREAVKILVALGVLEIRRADGTYVVEKYSQKLLNPVIYGLVINNVDQSAHDMLEMNICILHEIMKLAKSRLAPGDLEHMEELYQKLRQSVMDPNCSIDQMTENSTQFYKDLTRLAKNQPIIQVYDVVLDLMAQIRRNGFVYAVNSDYRAGWMENYVLIMRYLRGEISSAQEICDKIAATWYECLA